MQTKTFWKHALLTRLSDIRKIILQIPGEKTLFLANETQLFEQILS